MFKNFLIILMLCALQTYSQSVELSKGLGAKENEASNTLYTIEGLILPPDPLIRISAQWPADITLSINGGEYQGFVRLDGSFTISGVPSGSYILYAHHADIFFQPVRVDIAHNGKFRARKVSHIKPSHVVRLPYPLVMKPVMRRRYFRTREQWNIMDYVLNPMVLLMVVPLMLMLLLPRLINDPETKREIESIQFPKIPTGMPDLSDVLTSLLTGKRPPEKEKKAIVGTANKRRN
ncbi:ER membrane protein complex subunit 7 homolog [Drosophila virilis]|uniref:ER membrane protein complex subunit 7 beta-sandwich domain-containing protein n=1 Tax=Drosophila virilis TaxID=7244 RepID=B4LSD6_DROVI|nr:ER membrane protein complex subunit 7 homolog [Drosophila virilis]EDW63744.2 uncharacterized protein Dvir_GJ16363 [Drosophila virilis]